MEIILIAVASVQFLALIYFGNKILNKKENSNESEKDSEKDSNDSENDSEDSKKDEKKSLKNKDDKPKTKSAYVNFCSQNRNKVKGEFPEFTFGELSKKRDLQPIIIKTINPKGL